MNVFCAPFNPTTNTTAQMLAITKFAEITGINSVCTFGSLDADISVWLEAAQDVPRA
jgi:hypothetical protein